MENKTVILKAKHGLHVRPAALLIKTAKEFDSAIELSSGGRSANAKSMSRLQLLELTEGSQIDIQAEGSDAAEAVARLATFIEQLN